MRHPNSNSRLAAPRRSLSGGSVQFLWFSLPPLDVLRRRDQNKPRRLLKIEFEPSLINCVKTEIDIISQIRFERWRGQFEFARRVEGDFRDVLHAEIPRGGKIRSHFRSHGLAPRRPNRENRRESRKSLPLAHQVVHVEDFFTGDAQRGPLTNNLSI